MVSVDTGPMHIAAMVGTPLVTLFHPALARLHHPYNQRDGVLVPPVEMEITDRVWDSGILASIQATDVIEMIDRKLGGGLSIQPLPRREAPAPASRPHLSLRVWPGGEAAEMAEAA